MQNPGSHWDHLPRFSSSVFFPAMAPSFSRAARAWNSKETRSHWRCFSFSASRLKVEWPKWVALPPLLTSSLYQIFWSRPPTRLQQQHGPHTDNSHWFFTGKKNPEKQGEQPELCVPKKWETFPRTQDKENQAQLERMLTLSTGHPPPPNRRPSGLESYLNNSYMLFPIPRAVFTNSTQIFLFSPGQPARSKFCNFWMQWHPGSSNWFNLRHWDKTYIRLSHLDPQKTEKTSCWQGVSWKKTDWNKAGMTAVYLQQVKWTSGITL